MSAFRLIFLLPIIAWLPAQAQAPSPTPLQPKPYEVVGDLKESDDGQLVTAHDISGIACREPPGTAKRNCIVINDQDTFAQRVIVEDGVVRAGPLVPLIGKAAPEKAVGTRPDAACAKGEKKFKDLDGEGVAYAEPYFYVVGSHGCSRNDDEFRLSSFLLVRFEVGPDGKPIGIPDNGPAGTGVEATYRLSDALMAIPELKSQFQRSLSSGGLNIEGISIAGGRMFVGLRAPSDVMFSVDVADLFAPGKEKLKSVPKRIPLKLRGNGVRDVAALMDGRLLVLAGAVQDQVDPYPVLVVTNDGVTEQEWTLATVLAAKPKKPGDLAKAEAVLVLEEKPDFIRILVMFDGLPNGGPREYLLKRKKN